MSEEKYGSVITELIQMKYTGMPIVWLSICEDIILEWKTITSGYLLHFGVRIISYLSSLTIVISFSSLPV